MKRLLFAVTAIVMVSLFAFAGNHKPKEETQQLSNENDCTYSISCPAEINRPGGEKVDICPNRVRAPYLYCGAHGGMTCW